MLRWEPTILSCALITWGQDWLASQVVEMVKKSPKEFPGAMRYHGPVPYLALALAMVPCPIPRLSYSDPALCRDVWSRTLRVAIPQVVTVAQSYTELSDSCLIYLRTELRHICFNELKFIQVPAINTLWCPLLYHSTVILGGLCGITAL